MVSPFHDCAFSRDVLAGFEDESGDICIKNQTVTLRKMGVVTAELEFDEKCIDQALFTNFDGVRSLVVVAGDTLYTIGTSMNQFTITLPFAPTAVVSCSKGLVLVSESKLFLMTSPMRLLGLILPSSTSTIPPEARPIFFGDNKCNIAVFQDGNSVFVYHIRYLARQRKSVPTRSRSLSKASIDKNSNRISKRSSLTRFSGRAARSRLSSRMSDRFSESMNDRLSFSVLTDETPAFDGFLEDFEYKKEAVITFMNKLDLSGDRKLRVVPLTMQNWTSINILDPDASVVHRLVYSHGNTLERRETIDAQDVIPLAGLKVRDQEFSFMVVFYDGNATLCSPIFDGQSYEIDIDDEIYAVQESHVPNAFKYRVGENWMLCQLGAITCPLVKQCLDLLAMLLEPEAISRILLELMIHSNHMNQWATFESIIVSRLAVFNETPRFEWLKLAMRLQKSSTRLETSDIIIYLHLLREDLMLRTRSAKSVRQLGHLLSCLAFWADWSWKAYYWRDGNGLHLSEPLSIPIEEVPGRLPVVFECFVSDILPPKIPYPDISAVKEIFYHTNVCKAFFETLSAPDTTVTRMLDLLKSLELSPAKLETFSVGPRFCIMEILSYMQIEAGDGEFYLLDRRDLAATSEGRTLKIAQTSETHDDDHLSITRLIFGTDRRFYEVMHLLQINKSQQCDLLQPPNCTEHDWVEMQQAVANLIANRTLAAAFGRAALYFSSKLPVISERMELPKINFDVYLRDHNVSVVFNPENLNTITRTWGYLAHGAAAGLSISKDAKVTSQWIVYNNSQEFTLSPARHAGFLLGLGIVGHLKSFEEWHIYQYLGAKVPVVSNALLLGLAASQLGSMNAKLTKVLSVHISALLPLGSSDLNVNADTQTAAIVSMGLLYLGTQNRRMSEVMLSELRSETPDREEMYRTACGIALGLMNLGHGRELLGLFDVAVVEKLQATAVIQSDAIPLAPLQLSQNGAILALMLMFLGTNDEAVASSLDSPTSSFLADYARPDILYTQSMARNLIMLDRITASREWVESQIPQALHKDITQILHHDSDLLPFFNILCGTLVSLGIKFAGTGDEAALETILFYIDEFRRLTQVGVASVDEKICKFGLMSLQARLVVASAIIAAGRGTIEVLQRLRPLFVTTAVDFSYDEFVGISMAMGILFLGGGQYSFSNTPKSLAFLAISLMSLAGAEAEAASWEHLRFFWAFATEKRCLIVRDVDTHVPVQVGVKVLDTSGLVTKLQSPCLLPSFDFIQSISVQDKLLLPINIPFGDSSSDLARSVRETKTIFVQKAKNVSTSLADRIAGRPSPDSGEALGEFLYAVASDKRQRGELLWSLRLILVFADSWKPNEELRLVPRRWLDKVKTKIYAICLGQNSIFG